jgi:hypothetical protein
MPIETTAQFLKDAQAKAGIEISLEVWLGVSDQEVGEDEENPDEEQIHAN